MKYLKNYKLFESVQEYDIFDAIDCLSQETVEEHFKDSYDISFETVCEFDPKFPWEYVDSEKFVESYIEDKVDRKLYSLQNLSDADYIDFFESNYNIDDYKYFFVGNYKSLINENTTEVEFIKIIEHEKLEEEFIKDVLEYKYDSMSPKEIAEQDDEDYLDNTFDLTYMFVDDNKVVDEFTDNQSWDTKFDFVASDIPYNPNLQTEILENDPKNAMILFDIIDFEGHIGIAANYNFQKAYIKHFDGGVADALKNLYDKFKLNTKIEEEYKDEMYLIDAEKYNL